MTCGSCELLLERKLKDVPGIKHVDVSQKKGTATIVADADNLPNQEHIASVIHGAGYSIVDEEAATISSVAPDKQKWMEIGACLLIIFALYQILREFDLIALAPSTTGALSLGGVLLIGLIAGTSSCLAVTGGLLLAMAAKYNEIHQSHTVWEKFRPLLRFNVGRLVSYFVCGGLAGVLGKSITLSTTMTGYMNIVVALVMFYLALTVLQILPKGSFPLRPPKSFSRWVAGLSESEHPAAPFALGAMTFFLPCGFTQSLQIAALASGSFLSGALIMFIFALGTLPSLLGISAISSTASGTFSRIFLRFSGALVLVLALFNLNAGFALTGIDLTAFASGNRQAAVVPPPSPSVRGSTQEIAMQVESFGYEPSNFTIKAGVPVRWVVDATRASGCTSSLVVPALGISKILRRGENVIEFTAPKTGTLAFSCGMGMVRGSFTVI